MSDVSQMVAELTAARDQEQVLLRHFTELADEVRQRAGDGDRGAAWRPGERLRVLLVGYAASANVGAEVRTSEIVRQLRALFGEDELQIALVVSGTALSERLYPNVEEECFDTYFPVALARMVRGAHVVISCEGSMFKSTFSETLTGMLAGTLAFASAAGKPAIAYGGEAGAMSEQLSAFVARSCRNALLLARSSQSAEVLRTLGLTAFVGGDTAWTFEPGGAGAARRRLVDAGWDGEREVLAVAPINPFWFPARLDLARGAELERTGNTDPLHYGASFFMSDSVAIRDAYARYVDALVGAIETARCARPISPVVIGMMPIDRRACEDVAARLHAPVFMSGELRPDEIVALLRRCDTLVSSRYHAVVTALPAGIAAVAVSMDERLPNLMTGDEYAGRVIEASDPHLRARLTAALAAIPERRAAIAAAARRTTFEGLRAMGTMGMQLCDELQRTLPEFVPPERPRCWEAHLPPLSDELEAILAESATETPR